MQELRTDVKRKKRKEAAQTAVWACRVRRPVYYTSSDQILCMYVSNFVLEIMGGMKEVIKLYARMYGSELFAKSSADAISLVTLTDFL